MCTEYSVDICFDLLDASEDADLTSAAFLYNIADESGPLNRTESACDLPRQHVQFLVLCGADDILQLLELLWSLLVNLKLGG